MESAPVPVLQSLSSTPPPLHSPFHSFMAAVTPSPSLFLLYTAAAILAPFIFRRFVHTAKMFWALRGVPGPSAVPLVGNVILFTKGNSELYRLLKLANKIYGSMFQLWIGQRPVVFLFRAEVVQPLLTSTQHIDKSCEYNFLQPWLGKGLVTSTGDKWHSRRKLLTNTLHMSVLEVFLSLMIQESDTLVRRLEAQLGRKAKGEEGEEGWCEHFDVVRLAKLSALDATCKTIMGINANEQSDSEYLEYMNAIEKLTSILHQRFLTPWLRPDILFNLSALGREHDNCIRITRAFADKVILERKEERAKQKEMSESNADHGSIFDLIVAVALPLNRERHRVHQVRRKALLDLLLDLSENGEHLTDQDIREEVDTFMFAGHDTISACFSWTLYLLGHHPEIQDEVVREVEAEIGDKLDYDGDVTMRDLGKLEYMECCIKETMRLFPPVPLIGRDLKTPLKIQGHTLRPGTTVCVATYILHRDPKVFPDPEKFDPSRFTGPAAESRSPYAYTPFSAGSRNCIGRKFAMTEVKLMLSKVLRNFEFRSIDGRRQLRLQGEIVLNNANGVRLSVRRRNKNNNEE